MLVGDFNWSPDIIWYIKLLFRKILGDTAVALSARSDRLYHP